MALAATMREELAGGHPCAACAVREWALCQPVPEAKLCVLDKFRAGQRLVAAGEYVFHQGDVSANLYTVIEGWGVQYRLLEDGRRQITRIVLPGDFLGYQADLDAPSDHGVQSITAMRLCVFPRAGILSLFREHPEVAMRMIWLLARDEARSQDWLTNIGRRSALERVAHFLLELYYRIRVRDPESLGPSVPLPLTQEHVGDALGLTSVHVNRTLRELRARGLLVLSRRTLQILDPDGLAEIAGLDGDTIGRLKP